MFYTYIKKYRAELVMFLLVLFIIYYVNKSGTIEGLAEAEAEVIEQSEKDSEKEFRETLYDFKMKYFTYVRKRFASLVRSIKSVTPRNTTF